MKTTAEQKNRGNYKIEVWTVADLMGAISDNPNKGKKVIIPKYQRGLVWSTKQKSEFIKSVKQGFPFGALLLAQEKEGEYNLLDGLQRSSTIREHIKAPNKWFDISEISTQNLTWLLRTMKRKADQQNVETLKDVISSWIQSKTGFEETDGWTSFDLAREIAKKFYPSNSDIDELIETLKPILKKVKDEADISNTDIPVILYYGSKESLPTIFENLNSKGTKLSKYQIFAATWQDAIVINDKDIVKLVQQKYQTLVDQGLQIENYDEDTFASGPFNIFEYIFGFGKLLSNKYEDLFGKSDSDTADSIGFNLLAACLGVRINEMTKLPGAIKLVVASGKIEMLQKAIQNSTDFVYGCLHPYITLRVNRKKQNRNQQNRIYHTEYQIISLIAKVFKSKYDENFEENSKWKPQKRIFEKTIPQHYLFDIVRDVWRGSGDTRIAEILDSNEYEVEISRDRWETLLRGWLFENQLKRKETKRVSIRDTDYLFLNYIYTHSLSYKKASDEYDVEHILPVERLRMIAQDGIPISAVSNLCFLPGKLNKEKKSLTVYEYYDKSVAEGRLDSRVADKELKEIEEYTWTSREDLDFVSRLDVEGYVKFLEVRFEKLLKNFLENNKIS